MSWYYSRKYELINFFSEELNSAPFFAALHASVFGCVCGFAAYEFVTGGTFSVVRTLALIAVTGYSFWCIRDQYGEWCAAWGTMKPRDRNAFVWAVWPSFLIGIISMAALMILNSVLGLGFALRTVLISFALTGILALCGWLGAMTARHIIHGGKIRWGGIN